MGILTLIICGALPALAVKEAKDAHKGIRAYNTRMRKFNNDMRKKVKWLLEALVLNHMNNFLN